jgi:hypothetical protein
VEASLSPREWSQNIDEEAELKHGCGMGGGLKPHRGGGIKIYIQERGI